MIFLPKAFYLTSSSLRFTYEKESNHSLPFPDVLIERHDLEFITSVYRNPPSPASIYVRTLLVPRNGKSI